MQEEQVVQGCPVIQKKKKKGEIDRPLHSVAMRLFFRDFDEPKKHDGMKFLLVAVFF